MAMTDIEILQAELLNNQTPLYCTRTELCNAVDKAVEALQEKTERSWIPVTERLPEKETLVLLYLESGNDCKITTGKIYSSLDLRFDGEFCVGFDDLSPDFLYRKVVTHWMPLPDRPKEEEA